MQAIGSHFFSTHFYFSATVVSDLIQRICLFVKRHQMSFIVYAIEAGCMFLAGNRFSRIAITITAGLGWQLGYAQGAVLPEDLIEKYQESSDIRYHFPYDDLKTCQSLTVSLRISEIERLFKKVVPSIHPNWRLPSYSSALEKMQIYHDIFITGETGAGKTEILHCIADRLQNEGNLVYFLKKDIKIGFTSSSSQFAAIRDYLNSQGRQKRVYLLIDEFAGAVDISENLLSGVKNTELMHFSIIAAMVKPPQKMEAISNEMGRRFETIEIAPLDQAGVIEVEKKVKSRYGTLIEDEVIETVVEKVFKRTSPEEKSQSHSRVSNLLKEASSAKILSQAPSEEKLTLDIKNIMEKLKQSEWYKQSVLKKLQEMFTASSKYRKKIDNITLQYASEIAYETDSYSLKQMSKSVNKAYTLLNRQYKKSPLIYRCPNNGPMDICSGSTTEYVTNSKKSLSSDDE